MRRMPGEAVAALLHYFEREVKLRALVEKLRASHDDVREVVAGELEAILDGD